MFVNYIPLTNRCLFHPNCGKHYSERVPFKQHIINFKRNLVNKNVANLRAKRNMDSKLLLVGYQSHRLRH